MRKYFVFFLLFSIVYTSVSQNQYNSSSKIFVKDISVPDGYNRIFSKPGSFGEYLQLLELNNEQNEVLLFNGAPKVNQTAHFAIIKMDIGDKDLQQCADAIIRLRAEYLYKTKKYDDIHFNFTSGDTAFYSKYRNGYRPKISGNKVSWEKRISIDSSYSNFRNYLNLVFTYSGTYSLNKEMIRINNVNDMKIGDIFIQTGNPYGHAVIVIDMAINPQTKEKVFMLAQSFMPAQNIHILKNLKDKGFSPWYKLDTNTMLNTPEWSFTYDHLKRFKEI